MQVIELIATSEDLDPKRGTLTYHTDVEAGPGILVHCDATGEYDMLIIDQVHSGGRVSVRMRPLARPARKYAIGQVVAKLIQF